MAITGKVINYHSNLFVFDIQLFMKGYEVDQVTHVGPQHGSTTSSKALGGFSCYPDCGDGDKSVPIYNVGYNHVDVSTITKS